MELDRRRVAWVDYAKGFCIVMVVMMHSTLGVQEAAGATSWMGALVAFAKPFRMPDFFLISGLFLARAIDRDCHDVGIQRRAFVVERANRGVGLRAGELPRQHNVADPLVRPAPGNVEQVDGVQFVP